MTRLKIFFTLNNMLNHPIFNITSNRFPIFLNLINAYFIFNRFFIFIDLKPEILEFIFFLKYYNIFLMMQKIIHSLGYFPSM